MFLLLAGQTVKTEEDDVAPKLIMTKAYQIIKKHCMKKLVCGAGSRNYVYMYVYALCPQVKKGFEFESDTDTEVIAKLTKHVYDTYHHNGTFRQVVEFTIQQLVSITLVYMCHYFYKA